jgi:Xaa-Pro dipeptidase
MMAGVPQGEYTDRVSRARSLMAQHGIDCLLVTDPVSFTYFSGQNAPVRMKLRPSVFVLPLSGDPAIVTWAGPQMFSRVYNRPYPSWVEDRHIYPEMPFNGDASVDYGIRSVLEDRKVANGVLAIELGALTWLGLPVSDFMRLQRDLPNASFVESGPVIWGCRLIKSEWEIDAARQACAIGGRGWKRALAELRAGHTGADLQKKILGYYHEEGADLTSNPPLTLGATGEGGAFQKGDVLYLDGGCSFMGYEMDYTRRAVFGPPTDRQRKEHDTMWEILGKLMERMKPGATMAELFDYSQSLLAKTDFHNYSDHPAKRIGHGIGLETEPPSMNAFDPTVLAEGMTLTPEPKIESVDGLVNPEEHVVIRAHGCEILSTDPGWELMIIE